MMEDWLKGATKEVDKENALKEVAEATTKKKGKAVENAEEQARAFKRAQALAEQKMAEIAANLEETKLRLASAKSLNSVKDKEIVELKTTLKASKDKWYNTGFVGAKNSAKPVMSNQGDMNLMRVGWWH